MLITRGFFCFVVIGLILLLVVDIIGIKKDFRTLFNKIPLIPRVIILAIFTGFILVYGVSQLVENNGGFMYANF